jgi:hypothetical protein
MHLLIFNALAFLLGSLAHPTDQCPKPNPVWEDLRLDLINHKWQVTGPAFYRWGNESDPVSTTFVNFWLYYHKWDTCKASALAQNGLSCLHDPGLCGLDLEESKIPSLCSMYYDNSEGRRIGKSPHEKTLWRDCQGRFHPPVDYPENCKGLTPVEMMAGAKGCNYPPASNVENISERPWTKWRVAASKLV